MSLSETINQVFNQYTGWFVSFMFADITIGSVSIPWIIVALIACAVYFTFYLRGINFTGFVRAIQVVRGRFNHVEEPSNTAGEVTKIKALLAALSGTLGLGNIAGVAVAISVGGPGATVWMIIAGLLAMASKMAECTLGVKYRMMDEEGIVYGGPMYYLSRGLNNKFGKILATIYCVMCIGGALGGGNMFQSNQSFRMVQYVTGGEQGFMSSYAWLYGLILAVIVGLVIIGGFKSIANVSEKIVPFMVLIYMLAGLIIIAKNIEYTSVVFSQLWQGATQASGIAGGVLGALIQGFRRASFSNEAGIGSASIAHATVKTNFPASEGYVSLLEPFIDTVLVCSLTAFTILYANAGAPFMQYGTAIGGDITVTAAAFAGQINGFSYVLCFAVLLFAFCTIIGWSYYGYQSWLYLFGKGKKTGLIYYLLYCICTFIGACVSIQSVIDFSDAMIFAMLVPNVIGLVMLGPVVKNEIEKYHNAIKK